MEEKKSVEEIMFPEVKIGDIVIKPWSFGTLFDISTMLEVVIAKVKEKEIFLDPTAGFISYIDMAHVFTLANQEVLKIISITVDRPEEEIRKLSIEDGIKIAIAIKCIRNIILMVSNTQQPWSHNLIYVPRE